MKLKKQDSDYIDLKQQEKTDRWAEEMLGGLTGTLPIMTSIAKNTESAHFSFMGLARHGSLAESLIFKSKRFRTTSEVYRAAMYIGMSVLYYLTKDEGTMEQKARATQIYKTISTMESLNHSKQIVDAVVLSAKDVIECAQSGVIDFEEMEGKITTLIGVLPRELSRIASEKIKRIIKGDQMVDIAETRIQRGAKKRG